MTPREVPGSAPSAYHGSNVLKWISKSNSIRSAKPAPRLRIADAEMQAEAIGRLPQAVAGGRTPEPSPEYIREAAEASEDVWAREQELYRRKQEQRETES